MTLIGKLRRLLSRRDKKFLIGLLGASIFVSFLETFSVSLIMVFAAVATNFNLVFENKYYSYAYRLLGCSSPSQFVILMGLGLIVFYFFRGAVITTFTYVMNRFSQGRFKYFAFKFFEKYLNFHYKDFTTNHSSKISKIIFTDANQLTQILSSVLTIMAEVLTVSFIYFSLLFVHWKMTAVLTIILCLKVLFIVKAFSARLAKAGKVSHNLTIEMSKTFSESFGNFKLIKLLSNEKPILKRFNNVTSSLVKANTINAVLQNAPRLFLETVGFSLLIGVMVYVIYFYNDVTNIIPVLAMYAFAFYRFLPSVNKIISEYNRLTFCKHALENVQDYLLYNVEELGKENVDFKNDIKLKNVAFSYDSKNSVLSDINLTIKKGQRTAFVGQSGGGKSTLVDVIMGLYKPSGGAIYVDRTKLDDNNIKDWRKKIGYIPQQIYLFAGTIAENIVFNREYDEQKVIEVLKKANIYDYLLSKDGISSHVGEGGILLSGGQKQRIAIARALYSDPEILVLDEATSALDHKIEEKIMDEIYKENKDKTLIIVAHRLTTVERCDYIYKIENGAAALVEDLHSLYEVKSEKDIQVQA
jgi:ATP-binding cassette, subfamily B, bacterial PglK